MCHGLKIKSTWTKVQVVGWPKAWHLKVFIFSVPKVYRYGQNKMFLFSLGINPGKSKNVAIVELVIS